MTISTLITIYILIGIMVFMLFEIFNPRPIACPRYYYTFGATIIVLLWPVILLDESRWLW